MLSLGFETVLEGVGVHDWFLTCSIRSLTEWGSVSGVVEGISHSGGDSAFNVRMVFPGTSLLKIASYSPLVGFMRTNCGLQLVSSTFSTKGL